MSLHAQDTSQQETEKWPKTPANGGPTAPSDSSTSPQTPPTAPPSPRALGGFLSVVGAVFTVLGVIIAAWQLIEINYGAKIDRANSAAQHFLTSEDIRSLSRSISAKTDSGKNYEAAITDKELRGDLVFYLNALEMIAGGVNCGIYNEAVIHYNLAETIYKHVTAHLFGKPGTLPSGEHWFSNSKTQPLFPSRDEFPELRKLYKKWFPNGEYMQP